MTTNQPSGRASRSAVLSHGARQKSDRSGAAPRDLRGRLALAAAADSGRYPLIVVQADCHWSYGMQFSVPSSHVVIGVFQNLMLLK